MMIELLQVAIGIRERLTHVLTNKEWHQLYEQTKKQAVAGVCFAGVEKLPKEQWPPRELLYEWISVAERIRQKNIVVDMQSAKIWQMLKEAGLYAAVLKGQGIARLYRAEGMGIMRLIIFVN